MSEYTNTTPVTTDATPVTTPDAPATTPVNPDTTPDRTPVAPGNDPLHPTVDATGTALPTVDGEAVAKQALTQWTNCAKRAGTVQLVQGLAGLRYCRAKLAVSDTVQLSACYATLVARWQEHSDRVVTAPAVVDLVRLAGAWEQLAPHGKDKDGNTVTLAVGTVPLGVIRA